MTHQVPRPAAPLPRTRLLHRRGERRGAGRSLASCHLLVRNHSSGQRRGAGLVARDGAAGGQGETRSPPTPQALTANAQPPASPHSPPPPPSPPPGLRQGLTFAESREAFPYPWSHVSSLDHAAIDAADELLVISGHAFVFCTMLSGALQVATQTVHMLYRGLRDGAPRTLTPADESVVSLLRLVPRTERRGAQGGQRCRVGEEVV